MIRRSLPVTRAGCENAERPCGWVSCRHHLLLDVLGRDRIKVNFPEPHNITLAELDSIDLDVLDQMKETCAIDVANKGEHTLPEVGVYLGVTRQRIEQVEKGAREQLARRYGGMLHELLEQSEELEV